MPNQVTLTFAGDTEKLEQAFDRVGAGARNMGGSLANSVKAIDDQANHLGRLGERADNAERNIIGLHDVIDGTATIMEGPGKQGIVAYIQGWADLAGGLAPLLLSLAETKLAVVGNTIAMAAHATWSGIVKAATVAWTGVQWLLNVALLANPIVLIVAGIILLVGVIVLIATKTTWFQTIWKIAWGWIKNVASDVWDWLKELPGKLGKVFGAVANFITAPFRLAFNFVADAWNNTVGKLSWTVPDWIPGLGGKSISVPRLPHFHGGGVVPGLAGTEVLAVLQAGERVTPAGSGAPVGTVRFVGERAVVEFIRRLVDERGGGNVQVAFGRE